MALPPDASEASRKRYQLAVRLAEACPPELASEIAMTGSTARGWADDDSDLELNLWSESVPPAEARAAWLAAAGVEQIEVTEQPRPDQSYWIAGRIGDVPLEVGWQTYATVETTVGQLLRGDAKLVYGDILLNSLPLRTQGRLGHWQAQLRAYPDSLEAQIIQNAVKLWVNDGAIAGLAAMARRGERLALTEMLTENLSTMMSVLYAVNRLWQPSRKWTLTAARDLPLMPENWRERIDGVLAVVPETSIRLCCALILDALALVPPQYDVSEAVRVVRAFADGNH